MICDDVIALPANDKCKTLFFSLNFLRTAAQLERPRLFMSLVLYKIMILCPVIGHAVRMLVLSEYILKFTAYCLLVSELITGVLRDLVRVI